MAKAGRGADQYMLRFPEGLRDRIKAVAERNGTSINSEIVRVLEKEFPETEQYVQELSFMDEIDDIQQKLERIRRAQYELQMQRAKAELNEVEKLTHKADKLLDDDRKE